jgi:hypothetical protein
VANETAMTSAEKKADEERRIDAAVRAKLTCPGCGKGMVPVLHKSYCQWTCPVPGCSRMIGPKVVEGWINSILVTEAGITGEAGKAKAALRRYEQALKKSN